MNDKVLNEVLLHGLETHVYSLTPKGTETASRMKNGESFQKVIRDLYYKKSDMSDMTWWERRQFDWKLFWNGKCLA